MTNTPATSSLINVLKFSLRTYRGHDVNYTFPTDLSQWIASCYSKYDNVQQLLLIIRELYFIRGCFKSQIITFKRILGD